MTKVELTINNVSLDNANNPEQAARQMLPIVIPRSCQRIYFKKVRVNTDQPEWKSMAKTLFNVEQPMQVMRFLDLRVDDLKKFMKCAISEKS